MKHSSNTSQQSSSLILVGIMGPTGSGKTGFAESIAERLDATLINADAFQVYRYLDIGTAKPTNRGSYKLLDIREPNIAFGLGEWTSLAQSELERTFALRKNAVVVGGTGLYIRALFEEYSDMVSEPDPPLRARLNATPIEKLREELCRLHPKIAAITDLGNPVRVRRAFERLELRKMDPIKLPPYKKLKIALNPPVEVLNARIAHRSFEMMHNGWVQEVKQLRERGFKREDPGLRAIGYRAIWDHIENRISLDEATTATIAETRRYAKRQRTWLRSEPSLLELSVVHDIEAISGAMERIESVLM